MSFARSVAFILRPENDGQPYHVTPDDPGGATAYGWALRENPDLTDADLRVMTPQTAAQRYERVTWARIRGYELPDSMQLPMLDTAVVEGAETAIRFLQTALHVPVDGVLGPQTLQAAAHANAQRTVERFTAARIVNLSTKKGWPEFRDGWTARAVAAAMEAL